SRPRSSRTSPAAATRQAARAAIRAAAASRSVGRPGFHWSRRWAAGSRSPWSYRPFDRPRSMGSGVGFSVQLPDPEPPVEPRDGALWDETGRFCKDFLDLLLRTLTGQAPESVCSAMNKPSYKDVD